MCSDTVQRLLMAQTVEIIERGLLITLQARQEKKALTSRGRGLLRGFLELRPPWGFSHEARRGSQGASRAAPGKSGLHERGEGERVIVLESWEGTRAGESGAFGLWPHPRGSSRISS